MGYAILLVLAGIILLAALIGVYFLVRMYYLGSRVGAFRTLLRVRGQSGWKRGYARYGETAMAWFPIVGFRWRPGLLMSREELEVVDKPTLAPATGTATLRLRSGTSEYDLILSMGDYTGLIAWTDSRGPRELP